MSNNAVGAIYKQIIDDVVASSRPDFEDGGIEESVLEELKTGWERKLSALRVAAFPWDPKIIPEPKMANPPPAPKASATPAPNISYPNQPMPPSQTGLSLPITQPSLPIVQPSGPSLYVKIEAKDPSRVKPEPAFHQAAMAGLPRGTPVAQQRAARQLESQFGQRAAASISAIHNSTGMPGSPGVLDPAVKAQHQEWLLQQAQANGLHRVQNGQADGSDERPEESQEMTRAQADRVLHAQMLVKAKQMEGGGMLLPMRPKKKDTKAIAAFFGPPPGADSSTSTHDGAADDYDDEKEDEDAINSDLDDADSGNEDEDDDETGQHMFCMYDKVQRVKNKWKCTLKDGVLSTNGKDYVFHKATGEFEW